MSLFSIFATILFDNSSCPQVNIHRCLIHLTAKPVYQPSPIAISFAVMTYNMYAETRRNPNKNIALSLVLVQVVPAPLVVPVEHRFGCTSARIQVQLRQFLTVIFLCFHNESLTYRHSSRQSRLTYGRLRIARIENASP